MQHLKTIYKKNHDADSDSVIHVGDVQRFVGSSMDFLRVSPCWTLTGRSLWLTVRGEYFNGKRRP